MTIWTPEFDVALLRRVLSEYLAGNRIVNGHWYAPDETGERQCPRCKGDYGGWVRIGGDDWDWEPCALCGEAGYIVIDGEPHFKNDAASAEELALLDSLRQESGL